MQKGVGKVKKDRGLPQELEKKRYIISLNGRSYCLIEGLFAEKGLKFKDFAKKVDVEQLKKIVCLDSGEECPVNRCITQGEGDNAKCRNCTAIDEVMKK